MSDQLTQRLIEGFEAAAQVAANPPDPDEARQQFARIITDQLQKGH